MIYFIIILENLLFNLRKKSGFLYYQYFLFYILNITNFNQFNFIYNFFRILMDEYQIKCNEVLHFNIVYKLYYNYKLIISKGNEKSSYLIENIPKYISKIRFKEELNNKKKLDDILRCKTLCKNTSKYSIAIQSTILPESIINYRQLFFDDTINKNLFDINEEKNIFDVDKVNEENNLNISKKKYFSEIKKLKSNIILCVQKLSSLNIKLIDLNKKLIIFKLNKEDHYLSSDLNKLVIQRKKYIHDLMKYEEELKKKDNKYLNEVLTNHASFDHNYYIIDESVIESIVEYINYKENLKKFKDFDFAFPESISKWYEILYDEFKDIFKCKDSLPSIIEKISNKKKTQNLISLEINEFFNMLKKFFIMCYNIFYLDKFYIIYNIYKNNEIELLVLIYIYYLLSTTIYSLNKTDENLIYYYINNILILYYFDTHDILTMCYRIVHKRLIIQYFDEIDKENNINFGKIDTEACTKKILEQFYSSKGHAIGDENYMNIIDVNDEKKEEKEKIFTRFMEYDEKKLLINKEKFKQIYDHAKILYKMIGDIGDKNVQESIIQSEKIIENINKAQFQSYCIFNKKRENTMINRNNFNELNIRIEEAMNSKYGIAWKSKISKLIDFLQLVKQFHNIFLEKYKYIQHQIQSIFYNQFRCIILDYYILFLKTKTEDENNFINILLDISFNSTEIMPNNPIEKLIKNFNKFKELEILSNKSAFNYKKFNKIVELYDSLIIDLNNDIVHYDNINYATLFDKFDEYLQFLMVIKDQNLNIQFDLKAHYKKKEIKYYIELSNFLHDWCYNQIENNYYLKNYSNEPIVNIFNGRLTEFINKCKKIYDEKFDLITEQDSRGNAIDYSKKIKEEFNQNHMEFLKIDIKIAYIKKLIIKSTRRGQKFYKIDNQDLYMNTLINEKNKSYKFEEITKGLDKPNFEPEGFESYLNYGNFDLSLL